VRGRVRARPATHALATAISINDCVCMHSHVVVFVALVSH
jgi:hypothetical protein